MEEAKRRVAIRLQAAKKKRDRRGCHGDGFKKAICQKEAEGFLEDRAPKKQKISSKPVLGLMAEGTKKVTPAKHGGGKSSIPAYIKNKLSPKKKKKSPDCVLDFLE